MSRSIIGKITQLKFIDKPFLTLPHKQLARWHQYSLFHPPKVAYRFIFLIPSSSLRELFAINIKDFRDMSEGNIDENILSLYNAQKWEEIAALSSTTDDLRTCRLSWILPDVSDLRWMSDIVREYNLSGIASVGCGCGLVEWLLQKYSGLDIVGIELDSSWWNSKYSPPLFLKNITFVENKSTNFHVPKRYAMLFCYFNNSAAFCDYMENYKGDLIFVIGPEGNDCTTDPLPFDKKFERYDWRLINERKLVYSNNYITAYSK